MYCQSAVQLQLSTSNLERSRLQEKLAKAWFHKSRDNVLQILLRFVSLGFRLTTSFGRLTIQMMSGNRDV